MNCFPDPYCRCCECRGIHCLVWHPGHSHRDVSRDWLLETLRASQAPKTEEPPSGVLLRREGEQAGVDAEASEAPGPSRAEKTV